jgi:hypothetical protein
MRKLNHLFSLKAATALSTMTLIACNLSGEERLQNIDAPKTVKAIGKNPAEKKDGIVTFDVDASRIGNMEYLFSKRIAVIFDGAVTPDRKCPYIKTDNRDPQYQKIGHRVFRVEAPSTPEEIEMVKREGCLITDSPPLSKIMGGNNSAPSHTP